MTLEETFKAIDKALVDLKTDKAKEIGDFSSGHGFFVPEKEAEKYAAIIEFSKLFEEFNFYAEQLFYLSDYLKQCKISVSK